MKYARQINGAWEEATGAIVFSPTVYQTAASLSNAQREAFGIYQIDDVYPVLTTLQKMGEPSYQVNGATVERSYSAVDKNADELGADESSRVASLWQAAHDIEYEAISGSAIGLITLGILQGKVKCLAVQSWIQSIWTLYYTRKAGTSTDTDYSSVGPCPHTVPDLMVELGL